MNYRAILIYSDGNRCLVGVYKTHDQASRAAVAEIQRGFKKSNAYISPSGLKFQAGWIVQDINTGDLVSSGEYEEAFA